MLEIRNLSCDINGKRLLNIEHLQICSAQFYGLLGANGAGKSTLLKVISGDLGWRGEIRLYGKPISEWSALHRARHLAVLPQSSQLNFPFTANEVVSLGLTPLSVSQQEGRRLIKRYMTQTDCLKFASRSYLSLSGGERQRVQLARVLLQLCQAEEKPLLLLDEPTSAQDLGQQHYILNLVKRLCEDQHYGVLAILHDLNQVLRYCQRCSLMQGGEISYQGKPAEILSNKVIEAHWQYSPERITLANGQLAII